MLRRCDALLTVSGSTTPIMDLVSSDGTHFGQGCLSPSSIDSQGWGSVDFGSNFTLAAGQAPARL
jgi:hypothetical protein